MRVLVIGIVCAVAAPLFIVQTLVAQTLGAQTSIAQTSIEQGSSPHVPLGIVSDWTHRHVLYPDSKDGFARERLRDDPRWMQNWYLRHTEVWWPEHWPRWGRHPGRNNQRDWSVPLAATPGSASFEPVFDFSYAIGSDTGYGSVTTTDIGSGQFLATSGTLNVTGTATGSPAAGSSFPLYPGGPAQMTSPAGAFLYDNVLSPTAAPLIDNNGLLFVGGGFEVNIWSDAADTYEFDDNTAGGDTNDTQGSPFTLSVAPGGGQTYPAKFVFDVTAAPNCSSDYVVIGVPATPASGGQANIVGVNNLYSGTSGALCSTGPTVMFAYASGTGEVPAPVVISQNGTQLAYIENLSGSSYFHVLTIGTTGTNGASAAAAVVPGSAGGNNAADQTVLLSPDGGVTNQSSTNAPWVVYTSGDADDFAYATTYSSATGSGYLYKIGNVFNGSAPTIVWSVAVNAIPSTPVYDFVSKKIFFTDSNGSIDYVVDTTSPTVVYGTVLASGATSGNPVTVDSTNQMVYATFNSNGTNALVVQAPTSMASAVSVAVGPANTIYGSPYEPAFNNAWYTGTGTPLLFVAGTGTGTVPTLYSVGFNAGGVLNSSADSRTSALSTGTADSSPLTEFYNTTLGKDFLFVGVTDNCVATTEGGTAGCVMSLDLGFGLPLVNANTTALAAAGGASGIIVDNDSSATGASSIYYATKTGATLVKATQSGLN